MTSMRKSGVLRRGPPGGAPSFSAAASSFARPWVSTTSFGGVSGLTTRGCHTTSFAPLRGGGSATNLNIAGFELLGGSSGVWHHLFAVQRSIGHTSQ